MMGTERVTYDGDYTLGSERATYDGGLVLWAVNARLATVAEA